MLKFILINGKAGSGKDTFAKYLEEYLLVLEKRPFIIHNAFYVKLIAEKIFGWDKVKDTKGRRLLIDIANTGYSYDDYFWERKTEAEVLKRFKVTDNAYIIIPDFRYKNTYTYFSSKYNVITMKIERENFDNKLSEDLKKDKSENLDIDFDYVIFNNGNLEDLKKQAKQICEYLRW